MNKQIVFTQLKPSIWQYKLARALKKAGYKPILISLLNFDKKLYKKAFSEIICLDLENLKLKSVSKNFLKKPVSFLTFFYRLFTLKPKSVICEGAPHYLAAIFLTIFKFRCPRIYFPYDMNFTRFKDPSMLFPKKELWGEKYCFLHCDAVFCKSATKELDLLPREFNIKTKKTLCVPHYVLEDWIVTNENKLSKKTKYPNIVHPGIFMTSAFEGKRKVNDTRAKHEQENFTSILQQEIDLHLYVSGGKITDQNKKSITKNDNKLEKHLFVHNYVSPDKLSKEISKYDYGFSFPGFELKQANQFSTGNRIASYLEAGLPFIVGRSNTINSQLAKEHGIGVIVDTPQGIKQAIKKLSYKTLTKKVKKFRKNYTIEKHVKEIINFINALH